MGKTHKFSGRHSCQTAVWFGPRSQEHCDSVGGQCVSPSFIILAVIYRVVIAAFLLRDQNSSLIKSEKELSAGDCKCLSCKRWGFNSMFKFNGYNDEFGKTTSTKPHRRSSTISYDLFSHCSFFRYVYLVMRIRKFCDIPHFNPC